MPARPPDVGARWPDREPLGDTGAVLVRPGPADVDDALALSRDPALWVDVPVAWRTTTREQQAEDVEAWQAHWGEHGFGYWMVRDPDALLGFGGVRWLWWRDAWALNVYVRFAAAAQGRGLATAMLGLAVDRLDGALAVPTTVVVRTRPANAAMARLAHRLGFDDAGTEEREMGTYRLLTRRIGASTGGS